MDRDEVRRIAASRARDPGVAHGPMAGELSAVLDFCDARKLDLEGSAPVRSRSDAPLRADGPEAACWARSGRSNRRPKGRAVLPRAAGRREVNPERNAPMSAANDLWLLSATALAARVASGTLPSAAVERAWTVRRDVGVRRARGRAQHRSRRARARAESRRGSAARRPCAREGQSVHHGLSDTCGSKILAGYHPPYDATVIRAARIGCGDCGKGTWTSSQWELDRVRCYGPRAIRSTSCACPAARARPGGGVA